MPKRKITLSWAELATICRKKDIALSDEEISEITLIKPRQILIRFETSSESRRFDE